MPPRTTNSPRSQNCRLPPPLKRQVQNQNKRCKTAFRWQRLSPSGQLLGTPGQARARRIPDPLEPASRQSFGPRPTSSHVPPSPRPWMGCWEGGEAKGREEKPQGQNDSGTGQKRGPEGCWGSSPRPRASAPNGGDQGSHPRQAASRRPGQRRRRRPATLPSQLSPPGPQGPLRGRGRRQRRRRGHSLTGGEGRSSRRLRQRRRSRSSTGSCRCGRRARSIPPQPPPSRPSPRAASAASAAASAAAAVATAASVPAREREPARGDESARACRHHPQPPPPAGGARARRRRARARCRGGTAPKDVVPPTHAVPGAWAVSLQVSSSPPKALGTEFLWPGPDF